MKKLTILLFILVLLPLAYSFSSANIGSGGGSSVINNNNYYNVTNITGGNITGSGLLENIPYWTNSTNLGTSIMFQNTSNIGIGTSSPDEKLTISGIVKASGRYITTTTGEVFTATTGSTGPQAMRIKNTGNDVYFGTEGVTAGGYFTDSLSYATVIYANGPVQNIIGGVSYTTLLGNGNFGIGTKTPNQKLNVNGSINATTYYGDGSQLTGISGGSSTNVTTTLIAPFAKIYKKSIDFESTTGGYTTIWVPTAISSGTAPVLATFDWNHPGLVNVTVASGVVGSGYAFQQSSSVAFILTNQSYFYAVFFPQCAISSLNITENRIGYQDSFVAAIPQDALYMNVSQNSTTTYNFTLTASNNSLINRGTTFSAPCNAWYSVYTVINNPNLATAYIYDVKMNLINTQTVTSRIPLEIGRETGSAVVTYMKGARYTNLGATVLDYFEIGINSTLVR